LRLPGAITASLPSGVIAKSRKCQAVQDGKKRRLRYRRPPGPLRSSRAAGCRSKPVRRIFFSGARFSKNARFVGRPLKCTHADAQPHDLAEIYKITDFENFFVDEVGKPSSRWAKR